MSRSRPRANSKAVTPLTAIADRRDPDHVRAVGRRRVEQAAHRLGADRADRDQQEQGVDQRGEDRRFLEPIGELAATASAWPSPRRPRPTTSPSTSERLCPASAISAIELAVKPEDRTRRRRIATLSAIPSAKARRKVVAVMLVVRMAVRPSRAA